MPNSLNVQLSIHRLHAHLGIDDLQTTNEADSRRRSSSAAMVVTRWTPQQVGDWLVQQDLGLYRSSFVNLQVNGNNMLNLDEECLDVLGVKVDFSLDVFRSLGLCSAYSALVYNIGCCTSSQIAQRNPFAALLARTN
jgi:hypothetical protein